MARRTYHEHEQQQHQQKQHGFCGVRWLMPFALALLVALFELEVLEEDAFGGEVLLVTDVVVVVVTADSLGPPNVVVVIVPLGVPVPMPRIRYRVGSSTALQDISAQRFSLVKFDMFVCVEYILSILTKSLGCRAEREMRRGPVRARVVSFCGCWECWLFGAAAVLRKLQCTRERSNSQTNKHTRSKSLMHERTELADTQQQSRHATGTHNTRDTHDTDATTRMDAMFMLLMPAQTVVLRIGWS